MDRHELRLAERHRRVDVRAAGAGRRLSRRPAFGRGALRGRLRAQRVEQPLAEILTLHEGVPKRVPVGPRDFELQFGQVIAQERSKGLCLIVTESDVHDGCPLIKVTTSTPERSASMLSIERSWQAATSSSASQ